MAASAEELTRQVAQLIEKVGTLESNLQHTTAEVHRLRSIAPDQQGGRGGERSEVFLYRKRRVPDDWSKHTVWR